MLNMTISSSTVLQATTSRLAATALLALAWSAMPQRWLVPLVVAPLLEETVFRAGLHEALLRRTHRSGRNLLVLNLLCGLVFALAHVALRGGVLAALTLLPALLIGAVYQHQRRLAPCIALHAVFNGVWLTLTS